MLVSCGGLLYDEVEDCPETPAGGCLLTFRYDYNMKYADAFAQEVDAITVYAFDREGTFVCQQSERGTALQEANYSMPLEVDPGHYHLVVWAGAGEGTSFTVPTLVPGHSTLADLTCRMHRSHEGHVDNDLEALFHGEYRDLMVAPSGQQGDRQVTIPLVKNTHSIRVMLQQLSHERTDVSKFRFQIVDGNGWMNYDNALLEDEELTYLPWRQSQGEAENGTGTTETWGVAVVTFTVGRLMEHRRPRLIVSNAETGRTVINIPLIDYLLLVKGHYRREMTNQEYLDRQDEYSLTFFLDEKEAWDNTTIWINGWTVMRDEVGI